MACPESFVALVGCAYAWTSARSRLHRPNELLGRRLDFRAHIVFAEFVRMAEPELRFSANPARFWPRLIYQWLYYRLIIFLERRMHTNRRTSLILIAKKTAEDLERYY